MTNRKAEIKKTYKKSLSAIQKVMFSLESTDEEVEIAEQALDGLTGAMLTQNLAETAGRTALLGLLITELHEVIENIDTENKFAGLATELTSVLTTAKELFKEEKVDI